MLRLQDSKSCKKCKKGFKNSLAKEYEFCNSCFCTIIEKRIRKHVRLNKIFSKGDKIIAVGELNKYLIPRILKDLPVEIEYKDQIPSSAKNAKVVVEESLDDIACIFFEEIFLNKKQKKSKGISIISVATDNELMIFSKLKKLNFSPKKKDPEIREMLDKIEAKHPETKFSLGKSIEKFRGICS